MRLENQRQVTYPIERRLLTLLREAGYRAVPEPITGSDQLTSVMPRGWKAWSLETWVPGTPWRMSDGLDVWAEIGALLALLHSFEVPGHGALRLDEHGQLYGQYPTAALGLQDRWKTGPIWIGEGPESLGLLLGRAPSVCERVLSFSNEVRDSALGADAVVVHSDLHSEHVLVADRKLVGVLDFGGAFRGAAGWDFAAIGVFNGWDAADRAITAYGAIDPRALARQSRLLGLSLGAYRFNVETAVGQRVPARRMLRGLGRTLIELETTP